MRKFIPILIGFLFVSLARTGYGQENLLQNHHWNFQTQSPTMGVPPWSNDPVITSDYTYVVGSGCLSGDDGAGKFTVTGEAHNTNGNFHYCGGHGGGTPNRFLVVNGFGGTKTYLPTSQGIPSDKKIIRYTFTGLPPKVCYDFWFWATHLSNGEYSFLGYSVLGARVKFRINNNGQDEPERFEPEYVPDQAAWRQSPIYHLWTSDNGTLTITLYDDCVYVQGYGDDFGIDDVYLRFSTEYQLEASDHTNYGCNGSFDPINVLNYVTINQPANQPTTSTVIKLRKNPNDAWSIATSNAPLNTNHGQAYVGSDNKIYYTPDDGFTGTDQVQYQVEKYGLSSWATLTLNVMDTPSNFVIHDFPEGHWCKGTDFDFYATCDNNNSPILNESWQWAESPNAPNNEWNALNFSSFPGVASCMDYYVRYMAENACGVAFSDPQLLHICDQPVLNKTSITPPDPICQGGSLPNGYLSQVSVNDWKNDIGTAGWWVKPANGSWQLLSNLEGGLFNGYQIKYRAENTCGPVETNVVTVSATDGPEFTQSTPALNAHYCVGDVLQLPSAPSYNTNGITITDQYWARSTDGETYTRINGNPTLTLDWNDNYICYRLVCPCGEVDSESPFQLHVFDAPVYLELLDTLDGPVCAGDFLIAPEEPEFYSYTGTSHGWAMSQSQDSTSGYVPVVLPLQVTAQDHGKWLKHYAEGCSLSYSNAVQITVHFNPTLTTMTLGALDEICAGAPLSLPEIGVVNWNGDSVGEGWEVLHNGNWEPYLPGTPLGISYNGASLRYWAESECGRTNSNPATISVIRGPEFTNPQPLAFAPFYCAVDEIVLDYPSDPAYQTNGSQVVGYWAWSEDNVDYQPITGSIVLTEEWNGRYVNYVLQSNCGDIPYPYPYQLTVYGAPQIGPMDAAIAVLDQTFCAGEPLSDLPEPEYASMPGADFGWQISREDGSWDMITLPYIFAPGDDGKHIRFFVSGCEVGYSEEIAVTVGDRPELNVESISDPGPVCEGASLDASYLNGVMVEDWHHAWSESSREAWEVFYQGQWQELPSSIPMNYHGCPLRYHAVNDCGEYMTNEVILEVIKTPAVSYEITSTLCTGQPLHFELLGSNGEPMDGWLWKYVDEDGIETAFDPDTHLFTEEGQYLVSYAVYNQCNEGNPIFSEPVLVTVSAGPEFAPATSWPPMLSVCDGQRLDEVLAESGMVEPVLVNPEVAHTVLGWFVKTKDENNNTHYDPWLGNQVITEAFHGAELCFGVTGDCSSIPVYSPSVPLYVFGKPKILSVSMSENLCVGEAFPPQDFLPEVEDHQSEWDVQWQVYTDQQWQALSTPLTIQNSHDEMQVRFVILAQHCGYEDESDPMTIHVAGTPEIMEDISEHVAVCDGGALGIDPPAVEWHHQSEEGVWQVSDTPNGPFGEGPFGPNQMMFNPNQVSSAFDGWYLRYHVEGCDDEDNSNLAELKISESADVHITGNSQVAQANSYWSGVYYYFTDVTAALNWSLEPPIWDYTDTIIDGKSCCRINVTSVGSATLTASVGDGSCGMDVFEINASSFGVDEQAPVQARIYPNPAQESVTVTSEEIKSVVVYDLLGQKVKEVDANGDESVSFGVGGLPEALYIVEVRTHHGVARQLLTITR